ncbi:Protein CBG25578 [Caenorhabditis briggsae]|uniref:Protein CBG25578 n=1 Tax=Caenorhabditis briggsae TaxID=6238 RepID=B6IF65_CAEBR|nr:Protein CBG25578 [Caenorhabditis briggsae]CAR98545.1 Protein CBG25578 [Caenorhabditis briggsae]
MKRVFLRYSEIPFTSALFALRCHENHFCSKFSDYLKFLWISNEEFFCNKVLFQSIELSEKKKKTFYDTFQLLEHDTEV